MHKTRPLSYKACFRNFVSNKMILSHKPEQVNLKKRKITRSKKVPNHEILGVQHLQGLYEECIPLE